MVKKPDSIEPVALYPKYDEFKGLRLDDFPEVKTLLDLDWKLKTWTYGFEFLSYIGRNKSVHTFTRFRIEVERFLLWLFLFKNKELETLKKSDILDYADFCWKPPKHWMTFGNYDRFEFRDGFFVTNEKWKPFKATGSKASNLDPDKSKYRPSQQSLSAMFTALIAFYKYLMEEEYLYGNPVQIAKKDCRYFVKDSQVKEIKRLSEEQWAYLVSSALEMAENDPLCERNLFLVVSLKTLFLRISEFSDRDNWQPVMGHFWQDYEKNWWLKVFGKGRKIRDITVPTEYLKYLKRYRLSRGLTSIPVVGESEPIIESMRGAGGLTSRQLTRLVQEVLDHSYDRMQREQGPEKSQKLKEASSHWLRHTGASMEIERGRNMKDLSEDLGHSSIATTDTIYVHSEDKKRAESGKKREV
jgi:integrase